MAPQHRLVMRTGPTPGQAFELTKEEITIGRDIHNDIIINDAEVSRKHARLYLSNGEYVLEDNGSTNGTFVDGQRLMGPHMLRAGELVQLGEKVSLAYEPTGFDPDATVVAAPQAPSTAPPTRQEQYIPPYQAQPPYREPDEPLEAYPQQPAYPPPPPAGFPPAYSGQVPPGPAEAEYYAEEEQPTRRTWLYAGCGCLVVLLCILVGAAIVFDSLNLYCTPPFNTLFACP